MLKVKHSFFLTCVNIKKCAHWVTHESFYKGLLSLKPVLVIFSDIARSNYQGRQSPFMGSVLGIMPCIVKQGNLTPLGTGEEDVPIIFPSMATTLWNFLVIF